uniref:Myotubularin phosphatase domain-containing protein n=1 Tax=Leersia perrieri TaxID=77586 RepID=A0A0D9XAT0_9ORYZ
MIHPLGPGVIVESTSTPRTKPSRTACAAHTVESCSCPRRLPPHDTTTTRPDQTTDRAGRNGTEPTTTAAAAAGRGIISPEMDGSGSWDTIDWNQIKEPRPQRGSSQGMEEFLLEDEEVYAQGHGVVLLNTDEAGILSVTNFRLLFVSQATKGVIQLGTIPLTAIEKINDDVKLQPLPRQHDKKQPRELLQVIGKDMRVIVFAFLPKTKQKNEVFDALRRYSKPTNLWDLYAFSCDPSTVYQKSDPKMRLLKEYHRLFRNWFPHSGSEFEKDLRNEWWRVTNVNSNYSLCSTYPSALIVPRSIRFIASFFFPIWQTLASYFVGLELFWQGLLSHCNTDEKLVSALCTQIIDATGSLRKLYIVDARPRANALANGAKGGGSESSSNYPRSEVLFLGIQNIHTMRDSLFRLRDYVDTHGSVSSNGISSAVSHVGDRRNRGSTWGGGNLNSMTQFSATLGEWLNHIQSILVGASWIAAQIAQESASVLVHCSDGWDRTTQLVALACLLLDPYYRTFNGFQKFLVDFMDCVLSCRFGNFLCNSEREREQSGAASSCHCMWMYLADLRASGGNFHEHYNPFYDPMKHNGPLVPPAAALAPTLWPQFYLRWTCPVESQGGDLESQWHAMSKKYTEAMKVKDAAESRAKDIKMKMESMLLELQREKRASSSALAMAQRAQRESIAIRKAVRSLGCTVNFAMNESEVEKTESLSYSIRKDTGVESQLNKSSDFSVSITAIEDSLVSETPSNHICESLCPFRTREGCRWPDAACAQLGSQFVGLKANFDAFDRLSVQDSYFGSE